MKVLTNGFLVILVIVTINCKYFTSAQTNSVSEEIDEEAFKKKYSISSEQVAQYVADINSARRSGFNGGVTYDAELNNFAYTPFNGSCEEGPISVLFQDDPRIFFFPVPRMTRCRGICPANHWCLANKRIARNFLTIEFRKVNRTTFIPLGIRRLRLKDESECECVPKCRPIICFPPRQFNERTCQCECPRNVCRRPFVLDRSTCECVCHKTTRCRYGYSFDQDKCRCYRKYK